ncbi:unnamed protein product [Tilletia caries]|nr:hypothetical protein CF336_g5328 [Tilletia laevis]KAE8197583.1 hypothetical protein CF335_g4578 [Tilletia laevis]CAD6885542.1 unnamed protein product [Tilletia caries]
MADSSSTSSKPVQRDSQPAPGDARTEEVPAGPERVPKDAMSPPAPAPTALHQRLQRSMGPSLGSSPMHSPRSALRALDPESQTRLGHHTPTSSPGAGSSALPIHLEGRSYRFQHSHNTDSPGATKAQLSTSPPVESDGVQYSSSYTATSNAIRDNTAMLANMALYDDDHSPDREEGGEEEEQDRTQVQSARVQWRDSSSSSSELGSGFQFQAAQSGDRIPDQDLLSTSPRAQPNRGPGMLSLALGVMDDGNQPPAIVTSPPPIEYSEPTPRLAGAVSQSTFSEFGQRCESNSGTTDTGSDFSVRAPAPVVPAIATASAGAPEENAEARRASVPTRHIAAAQHGEQQGPARAIHMQRRTSVGAATPQDLFIARATSMSPAGTGVNAFKPSSFSGFAAFGASHRGSFGFGALAQAQAQAEAQTQQAHHTGGSGAGGGGGGGSGDRTSGTSAIQLPGGFSFANARTSGVGGRRSSIARPSNPPGASSFSIHRTSSMGRRSLPHGGGGTNDSNYGSVVSSDVRDDNYERGRYGGRRDTHDSDDTDERQALLSADRSWRNVLGGRRQDSSPRPAPTRAATIYNAVTYPVRAVSSLLFSPRSRSRSPARSSSSGTPAVGARERIMKKMTKANLKAMVTEPITVLPAVVLGLLLNLLDGVSYGMITFPNSNPIFAHFGGDGVAMFFVTCIISQLIYSLGGSVFKAGNGSMMIEVVPFYHILVRKIVEEIGDNNPAAVIATTCMAFALSSVLTGLVFLLLGLLRLGVLIGFFPRHILVGCIGGVGIFLLETGFEVAGRLQSEDGFQYNLETLKFFFQSPHEVALWSIPLGLAILLRVITARFNHPLVVPAYFVIMPAVFFAVTLPFGFSLARLQGSGWVFDIGSAADAPFWRFYTYFDLTQTSWMALVATMPTQFALVFLSVLHPPLNIPALAVSVGQDDVNTDRELTAHGWSNIIAGAHVLIPALGFLIAGKHLQA